MYLIPVQAWTDVHHKLIHWRLVTHAGINQFSRLIVFMHYSDNNRLLTVYKHFLEATRKYGLPSRVRTDQGRENIMVAQHNKRIERLYMFHSIYYQPFTYNTEKL